jgi:hypothetical protein
MPTLGIFFDIGKIGEHVDSANYLQGAWKVVWRAVGVENLRDYRGALLYECDIAGEESEGCCVAVQSMHKPFLDKIQEALALRAEFQLVARLPMFAGESVRSQPLMRAGSIDAFGNVVGPDDYCSRPALESVRAEQKTERAANPIPESESKKSWLGRLFGGRKQDSMGMHHEPQQKKQSKETLGERSGISTVSIGDTNVGYRVIAVKKGAMGHLSIVLAERKSGTAATKYVVWAFDGTGFKSGIYENDRAKAQRVFDSRTN